MFNITSNQLFNEPNAPSAPYQKEKKVGTSFRYFFFSLFVTGIKPFITIIIILLKLTWCSCWLKQLFLPYT